MKIHTKELKLILIAKHIFRSDGVRGLYRGFAVSCTCIFIYRGLYFGLYDSLKPIVLKEEGSWVHVFLLGWLVTVTAGLAAYPVDTIKRRMMMTVGQKVEIFTAKVLQSQSQIKPLDKELYSYLSS